MAGAEIIEGEYLGPGVTCPLLRLKGGEEITLEGSDFRQTAKGTRLTLSGRFVMMSTCMQGRSFLVSTVEQAEAPSAN